MTPVGLSERGTALWVAVTDGVAMDVAAQVLLEEACRLADRLDKLDVLLRGEAETWATLTHRLQTADYELVIDKAMGEARANALALRQILATLGVAKAGESAPKEKDALDELVARRARRTGTADT